MEKLKAFFRKNYLFFLPILSGVLLFLAYPPQNLWFLVWVALIPLFCFIFSEKISPKKAFWGGAICGFIFMGGVFVWIFSTAPFEWLGVNNQKDVGAILFLMIVLWVFQIFLLGIFWGFFLWILKKIIRKHSGFFSFLIIVPCFWIIFDYLRAWWFEFIWLGKETFFGPHFTFGNLAYALHKIPLLIQSADIWGLYGIDFLVVVINSVLLLIVKSSIDKNKLPAKKTIACCLIVLTVFSFFVIYGNLKLKNKEAGTPRKVALLQTDFVSENSFNVYQSKKAVEIIIELLREPDAIRENPDFVIAPEGQGIVTIYDDVKIAKYLLTEFWKPGQVYIENKKIVDENQKTKSRLFYYDLEKENPIAYYEKRLLFANGDFLPYITKFLLSIYTYNNSFEKRLYQKGEIDTPAQTPKGIVGGTICASVVSPQINRQMANKGAEFLVIVASDAPFHKSKALLEQNFAMSQFRAVENRRYFAQSTNMGYSYLLSPRGETVVKSQNFGNEVLFANIELLNKKTPYTKFGDWLVFAAFIVLLVKLSYPQASTFLLRRKK